MLQQRRTFLGLRRGPPQTPAMNAYLVVQGLAIVLLADLGVATAMGDITTFRSICQAGGLWKDSNFGTIHKSNESTEQAHKET